MHSPKLLIVGAGAMGCTLAWHLAQGGVQVTLAARGESLRAIQAQGLQLWSGGEDRGRAQVRAMALEDLSWDFDGIIACVKQYDLPAVLQRLSPALARGVPVMPLVNGVPWWFYAANPHLQATQHPQHAQYAGVPLPCVIAGVVHIPAALRAPGVVEQGSRNRLVIGEPLGPVTARVQQFAHWLGATALCCDISDRMQDEVWSKLMGNAVFNPLSVLAQASMREMLEDPYLQPMAARMMAEVLAVGHGLDLQLPISVAQRMQQAQSAGDARTSMLQDAQSGKPLEVAAILGAVVHLGEMRGIPTPHLGAVWGVMRRRKDCF